MIYICCNRKIGDMKMFVMSNEICWNDKKMRQILMQRRENFFNAFERLKEALKEEPTELAVDGVLHRFEFTFELAWKLIKYYMEYMGIVEITGSPRETIQNGFKQQIIEDGEERNQGNRSRYLRDHEGIWRDALLYRLPEEGG